eukprot:m.275853 g.275853  ORF g.275853 m.275853 type:complete len:293 (-) comp54854_c0_seq15:960-1838(-)
MERARADLHAFQPPQSFVHPMALMSSRIFPAKNLEASPIGTPSITPTPFSAFSDAARLPPAFNAFSLEKPRRFSAESWARNSHVDPNAPLEVRRNSHAGATLPYLAPSELDDKLNVCFPLVAEPGADLPPPVPIHARPYWDPAPASLPVEHKPFDDTPLSQTAILQQQARLFQLSQMPFAASYPQTPFNHVPVQSEPSRVRFPYSSPKSVHRSPLRTSAFPLGLKAPFQRTIAQPSNSLSASPVPPKVCVALLNVRVRGGFLSLFAFVYISAAASYPHANVLEGRRDEHRRH